MCADEQEAWDMFQLADHLDCPRLMESCVQAIEKSMGENMLQASHDKQWCAALVAVKREVWLEGIQNKVH